MPALSKLQLWNQALARIRATPVASENENSLGARECRRFYPQVLAELVEGPAQFDFLVRRAPLTAITNDREAEWAYAYSLPAGVGAPLRVIPDFEALGAFVPVPLPGQPYAETWAMAGGIGDTPYIIAGDTLYSNMEGASIDFISDAIEGGALNGMVSHYVVEELGSRLAVPVKGDSKREQELAASAEVALQRAIAANRNRQPEQSGQYTSEAELARLGYIR